MHKTIHDYLNDLKIELQGRADSALIQDALFDADNHLQTALAEEKKKNPDAAAGDILSDLIDRYGTPAEVAESYLKMEALTFTGSREESRGRKGARLGKFFDVFAESRAWGAFFFLLFAFIPGILFGGWALFAGLFSAISLVFIIGLPVFGLYLLSIRGIAFLEGRLVEAMLGVRMPRRLPVQKRGLTWSDKYLLLIKDTFTWKALLYSVLFFPLGIIYSGVTSLLLGLALSFVFSPLLELVFHSPLELFGDSTFTPVWLLPFVCIAGLFGLTLIFHLAKWAGKLQGRFARHMLVQK